MFERDKNSPAILLWSLGNESGKLNACGAATVMVGRHCCSRRLEQGSMLPCSQFDIIIRIPFRQVMELPIWQWLATCGRETRAGRCVSSAGHPLLPRGGLSELADTTGL